MNTTVLVCVKERYSDGPSCAGRGSLQLAESLRQELAAQDVAVPVEGLRCFGRCKDGPNMRIAPGGAFFTGMTQERLGEVVEAARAALLASRGSRDRSEQQ